MLTEILEKPSLEKAEADFEKIKRQLEIQLQNSNVTQEAVSLVFIELEKLSQAKNIYLVTNDFDEASRLAIFAKKWEESGDLILVFLNKYHKILDLIIIQNLQTIIEELKATGSIFLGYSKMLQNPVTLSNYAEGLLIIANTVIKDWDFLSTDIQNRIGNLAYSLLQAELELENKGDIQRLNDPSFRTISKCTKAIILIIKSKTTKTQVINTSFAGEDNDIEQGCTWDREAQMAKNQPALELLNQWINKNKNQQETEETKKYFELFKEIIDQDRAVGYKLYSPK